MEEFWQAFSSSHKNESSEPEVAQKYAQQSQATTTPTTSARSTKSPIQYKVSKPPSSLPVDLSQISGTTTANAIGGIKPSRSAVQDAINYTRERRRIGSGRESPSVASDKSSVTLDSNSVSRDQVAKMLMQPDLNRTTGGHLQQQRESRNDQERHLLATNSTSPSASPRHLNQNQQQSSALQPPQNQQTLIHVGSSDELEVSISQTLSDSIGGCESSSFEEKKVDSTEASPVAKATPNPPDLSPNALYAKADEIILQAQKACSEGGAAAYTGGGSEGAASRELLHRALGKALDKAVGKPISKEENSEPTSLADAKKKLRTAATGLPRIPNKVVKKTSSASKSEVDAKKPTDAAAAREQAILSTQEVLQMANGVLKQASSTASTSSYLSPVPTYLSPVPTDSGVKSDDSILISKCLSPTESVGSIDDYEKAIERLPSTLGESESLPRSKILQRLDGVASPLTTHALGASSSYEGGSVASSSVIASYDEEIKAVTEESIKAVSNLRPAAVKAPVSQKSQRWHANASPAPQATAERNRNEARNSQSTSPDAYSGFNILSYFWGDNVEVEKKDESDVKQSRLPSSSGRTTIKKELPPLETSLVRVMSDPMEPGYADSRDHKEIDPRMPKWIESQFKAQQPLPMDGTYHLGASRTVIVHEIQRGNWTWCTAWSPDGTQLAVASENHHFAVVDTSSSPVWRVRHDKLIDGPVKKGTTHSIRSIAWGNQFIAIGGTGNAVSILAPTAPYSILHVIEKTGFVGSLDWLPGTNTLVIGSRLGKAMIAQIWTAGSGEKEPGVMQDVQSSIVHTIERGKKTWVNAVKFSPGGSAFAVGDGKGILAVYSYVQKSNEPLEIKNVANFKLEDSIMDVEWSADGQWLYAGGEDFTITVVNTTWWEAVHRIKRDRWVQFISSSKGGSHLAVGGVSSEVSILEVDKGWDTALKISLKGLVPLSASWHPQDQYLVLTGQNNSILAVETTNARYVDGHFLRSVSPILNIEFSPDGRMAAIGNEAGIVTIFKLSGTTFITAYELVVECDGALSIEWSLSGEFLCVASGSKLVVIAKTRERAMLGTSPPNASGFSVARVVKDLGKVNAVCISPYSRFIAVCGDCTRILDATSNFACVGEYNLPGKTMAASWSRDGNWLATIGDSQSLNIYDTSSGNVTNFKQVFTVKTLFAGFTLAWGPANVGGLQYIAYGGDCNQILIMEIRTKERTWETVLAIPREGVIHELDWSNQGLLAAAVGDGTVTIKDLSYLQSGCAVNEMNYNWQRQALTCFTELRRNKGKNCMRTVRWIPGAPGSDCLLAVGGTDGELEIVDLTERRRCSGYVNCRPPKR